MHTHSFGLWGVVARNKYTLRVSQLSISHFTIRALNLRLWDMGKVEKERGRSECVMNVRAHIRWFQYHVTMSCATKAMKLFSIRLCYFPPSSSEKNLWLQFSCLGSIALLAFRGCFSLLLKGEKKKVHREKIRWIIPFRTLIFIGLFFSASP